MNMSFLFRRVFFSAFLLSGLLLGPAIAQAQNQNAAIVLPQHVAQKDTLAVIRLDLQAIKPKELIAFYEKASNTELPDSVELTINATHGMLREAGVREIYGSVHASIIPNGGLCLVVPCNDSETVANFAGGLVAMLPEPLVYAVVQRPGQVIVCPKAFETQLLQVDGGKKSSRDDLIQGMQAASAMPHRLAVSIPKDLREMLTRVLPRDLEQQGSFELSPQDWMKNVSILGMGWDLPPNAEFAITTISPDAAANNWTVAEVKRLAKLVPGLQDSLQVSTQGQQATFAVGTSQIAAMLDEMVQSIQQAADRSLLQNNMKQLAIAMHNYYDIHNHIVPNAIVDQAGKPVLSWRVALLPLIGENELYQQFRLDESWASEHNKALLMKMPVAYADPKSASGLAGMTRIRLPHLTGSPAAAANVLQFKDITDGTSNTIWSMFAPESAAVEWTKPDVWTLDPKDLKRSIFGNGGLTHAAYFDGSVRSIDALKSIEWLRNNLQYSDGQPILDE